MKVVVQNPLKFDRPLTSYPSLRSSRNVCIKGMSALSNTTLFGILSDDEIVMMQRGNRLRNVRRFHLPTMIEAQGSLPYKRASYNAGFVDTHSGVVSEHLVSSHSGCVLPF